MYSLISCILLYLLLAQQIYAANIYAKSDAAGANNGTSFTDAYTNLQTALTAVQSGDTLFTDTPTGTPWVGGYTIVNKDNWLWVTDSGPNAQTHLNNAKKMSTATGPTSDVFAFTIAVEPTHVAYDLKQDDYLGTVTGCTVSVWERLLLSFWYGANPDWARCWYGFLAKDSVQDTTPADNTYTYTGGVCYVNPPGTPDQTTFRDKAIYNDVPVSGIEITNCDGYQIKSLSGLGYPLWVHFYPAITAGNGYGIRALGCAEATLANARGSVLGYHSFGFAGAGAGPRCRMRSLFSVNLTGDEGGAFGLNPYVFYQPDGQPEYGGHRGTNLVAYCLPRMLWNGQPVNSSYRANPCLAHTDTSNNYRDVNWYYVMGVDKTDGINLKHTLSNTQGGSTVSGPALATGTTVNNYLSYPNRVERSVFIGRQFLDSAAIVDYWLCLFDRDGCGNTTSNSGMNCAVGSISATSIRDSYVISGNYNTGLFFGINVGDYIAATNTRFLMQGTVDKTGLFSIVGFSSATDTVYMNSLEVKSNQAVGHALLRAEQANVWNNNFNDVVSNGANIFDTTLTGAAYHSNTGAVPTPMTFAAYFAAIQGAATDKNQAIDWSLDTPGWLRARWMGRAMTRPILSQ